MNSTDARGRVHRLAKLMDSSIRLPGGFRIGFDGLIGLLPVVGDLAAAGISFYIIGQAARSGVPAGLCARMILNVVIDGVVGAIPLSGDLFDLAFKANLRNARLMDLYLDDVARVAASPVSARASEARSNRFRWCCEFRKQMRRHIHS